MKLTRNELENLIKEAITDEVSVLLESPGSEHQEKEGQMLKQKLFHMAQQAQQLHDMIAETDNLQPWVQDKVTEAAAGLRAVFDNLIYDRNKERNSG